MNKRPLLELQSQLKLLGHFAVSLPTHCWCAGFGELTAINYNIERTRRRARSRKTGWKCPNYFCLTLQLPAFYSEKLSYFGQLFKYFPPSSIAKHYSYFSWYKHIFLLFILFSLLSAFFSLILFLLFFLLLFVSGNLYLH